MRVYLDLTFFRRHVLHVRQMFGTVGRRGVCVFMESGGRCLIILALQSCSCCRTSQAGLRLREVKQVSDALCHKMRRERDQAARRNGEEILRPGFGGQVTN